MEGNHRELKRMPVQFRPERTTANEPRDSTLKRPLLGRLEPVRTLLSVLTTLSWYFLLPHSGPAKDLENGRSTAHGHRSVAAYVPPK